MLANSSSTAEHALQRGCCLIRASACLSGGSFEPSHSTVLNVRWNTHDDTLDLTAGTVLLLLCCCCCCVTAAGLHEDIEDEAWRSYQAH
jgi:hypothetical protein